MAASRLARILVGGALVLVLVPALAIAARSYRQQRAVFFPPRKPVTVEVGAAGLDGIEPVSFGAVGHAVRGWYVPSRNRRAVLLVHGAGGDRSSLLSEARSLARRGFGVLSIDLPGHGESEGEIRWSEPERAALREAVGFLAARPELAPRGIGAFGFSLGGYVLVQVAAVETRIAALALAGTPSDPVAQVRAQHGRYSLLSEWPALFVLRRGGLELDVRAIDHVAQLAPRPLLVIGGEGDHTVPPVMAEQLFHAAGQPKELYLIPGAEHGAYSSAGGREYEERLVRFFEASLPAT